MDPGEGNVAVGLALGVPQAVTWGLAGAYQDLISG